MNKLKRIDLFNKVRVKVNMEGYYHLCQLKDNEINYSMDEDGYICVQLYEFFKLFANCVNGFDYFVYNFEALDGYKNINVIFDSKTDINISLTDLGMIELYDIAFDGCIDEPKKNTNLSVGMLLSTIGKYFSASKEYPIERSMYVKDKYLSKVKTINK